ncbi:plastocyanin/azurin family copper-binding protein [Aurantiacibacter gilvus]|uniref:Plastocyanin/azurin family copper-binding protein n=1 Tax=Aurantiacibacter gilvus TaxID=3139141 RepID=A0ABU9IDW4_9SPHN
MARFLAVPLALLLASCATTYAITPQVAPASTDFATAQRVEVHLDNFSFEPRSISLAAGRPVVLVLINDAEGGHNFSAPAFFGDAQVAAEDAARIAGGYVEVHGGTNVELRLIPAAGGYDVDCTHLGHSVLGMSGSIVVR